ncbi:MAG: orotidine-5'-phosphate decarboxylase [Chloroflexi bacterium]|nr:orotidine-5'-phosphate decarboxylase [Chloroflexota bacterium]|tara:strand:- start:12955 stop:13782 length:828 start_codon:yes stop_codon:yes gene_type:complete
MNKFIDRLDEITNRNQSLLCVGLDPWLPSMPIKDIAEFNKEIIQATKDLVCAYKPQFAFYEAEGIDGLKALEETLKAIPNNVPIILDVKRGDLGNTSNAYAKAAFEIWGADAVTVSPFMGLDSIQPFIDYLDKGIFILTRTSNPGGSDFQELLIQTSDSEYRPLYLHIASKVNNWNTFNNLGLVVGATNPQELQQIRGECPSLPILIPGIGAQGGDLRSSIEFGIDSQGRRAIINASRSIIYASDGLDFAEAARREALTLRNSINLILSEINQGW